MGLTDQVGDVLVLLIVTTPFVGLLLWGAAMLSRRRNMAALLSILPLALGSWFGISLVNAPHGYAAAYDYGGVIAVCFVLLITGSLLWLFSRTRRAGTIGFLATGLICVGFFLTWTIQDRVGLVRWKQQEAGWTPGFVEWAAFWSLVVGIWYVVGAFIERSRHPSIPRGLSHSR